MTTQTPGTAASGKTRQKRARSTAHPGLTIHEAARVARAVEEGGGKLSDEALATGLKTTAKASKFLRSVAAAGYYGLIQRKGGTSTVTDLGKRVVTPTREGDDRAALAEAFGHPQLFKELLQRFDGRTLPRRELFHNILHTEFGITLAAAPEAAKVFVESGLGVGRLAAEDDETINVVGEAPPPAPLLTSPEDGGSPPANEGTPPPPIRMPSIQLHIDVSGWTPDQLLEFMEKLASVGAQAARQDPGGST